MKGRKTECTDIESKGIRKLLFLEVAKSFALADNSVFLMVKASQIACQRSHFGAQNVELTYSYKRRSFVGTEEAHPVIPLLYKRTA